MVVAHRRYPPSTIRVSCMLTDQVGDAVYIRGQANGNFKVAKVDARDVLKMPAIGVIVKKWDFTEAVVHISGPLRGIYSELAPGRIYYVGQDGKPSLTVPSPLVGGKAYIQSLGVATDVGVLLVKPSETLLVRVG